MERVKLGDRIKLIREFGEFQKGDTGIVTGFEDGYYIVKMDRAPAKVRYLHRMDFEIYSQPLDSVSSINEATKGVKHDGGKLRMELMSTTFLKGLSSVLTFGAKKYAAHNWRNGIEQSRLIGAALRHLTAYNDGEDNDPESGLCHLYHASCCLMFLSELRETHPQLDDRYKVCLNK